MTTPSLPDAHTPEQKVDALLGFLVMLEGDEPDLLITHDLLMELADRWTSALPQHSWRVQAMIAQRVRITKAIDEHIETRDRPAQKGSTPTSVYVISGSPGLIKIGVSARPMAHLASLQTGQAAPLQLCRLFWFHDRPTAFRAEKALHHALADARANGEWFFDDAVPAGRGIKSLFPRDVAWKDQAA